MQIHKSKSAGRKRYRVIGGKQSVELKLRTPRQLFDERDPAPFRERDLDDDAARYIKASYRELDDRDNARLSLYFESLDELADKPKVIERAIHAFFRFEAEIKRRELRDIFRQGILSLFIGMTFLFLCVWFAHGLKETDTGLWRSMMHEGLLLMGWVSMWKPINIFLYEWWPIASDLKTLNALAAIDVQVLPLHHHSLQDRQESQALTAPASPSQVLAESPRKSAVAVTQKNLREWPSPA